MRYIACPHCASGSVENDQIIDAKMDRWSNGLETILYEKRKCAVCGETYITEMHYEFKNEFPVNSFGFQDFSSRGFVRKMRNNSIRNIGCPFCRCSGGCNLAVDRKYMGRDYSGLKCVVRETRECDNCDKTYEADMCCEFKYELLADETALYELDEFDNQKIF